MRQLLSSVKGIMKAAITVGTCKNMFVHHGLMFTKSHNLHYACLLPPSIGIHVLESGWTFTNEVLGAILASLVTSLSENSPCFLHCCLCTPSTLHSSISLSLTPGESSSFACTSLTTQTLTLHSPYLFIWTW